MTTERRNGDGRLEQGGVVSPYNSSAHACRWTVTVSADDTEAEGPWSPSSDVPPRFIFKARDPDVIPSVLKPLNLSQLQAAHIPRISIQ